MSPASRSSLAAGSMHSSSPRSPTCIPKSTVDPQKLEQKLIAIRDLTPSEEDNIYKMKAEVQRNYDQIIALGGRPTRPIRRHPNWKPYMVDRTIHYREEYEKIEVICEVDEVRTHSHWIDEWGHWNEELWRWRKFKEAQQIHNQGGRSGLELELENTDAALVGALSKLNDWQEFQLVHRKRLHKAERFHNNCQQGIARNHNAMVAVSNTDWRLTVQEPVRGWMSSMREAQKKLEASQSALMWVESQWTDVIAEACTSIAAVPNLQKQLEAKLEKQTKAIYRTLQEKGARPSHPLQTPDSDAEFSQRLQHWISQISGIEAELWDWMLFTSWRRAVKKGTINQEEQKRSSQEDPPSKLFEELVSFHQHELDKAVRWVDCWRRQAKEYREANKSKRCWPLSGTDEEDDDDSHDDTDDEDEVTDAKQAQIYAMQAEGRVSFAANRLEQSKQKLQEILAENSRPTVSEVEIENAESRPPPTPPKSQSPESLLKNRRPSKKRGPTGKDPAAKDFRRSKKEKARKGGRKRGNIDTKQQTLPPLSPGSNKLKENDDIDMSDEADDPDPVEIKEQLVQAYPEDTLMSDIEPTPNQTPPPPPESHSKSTKTFQAKKVPSSSSSQAPTSRKTRTATKIDQVPTGRVLKKKPGNKQPPNKAKVFTYEQMTALMNAASTGGYAPPTSPVTPSPVTPRRSERLKKKKATASGNEKIRV